MRELARVIFSMCWLVDKYRYEDRLSAIAAVEEKLKDIAIVAFASGLAVAAVVMLVVYWIVGG